jgi:hypothetical protein
MSLRRLPGNVYAILRFDEAIGDRVTVTKVLFDFEAAKAEVERLNALNSAKKCRYAWQSTRLMESTDDDE